MKLATLQDSVDSPGQLARLEGDQLLCFDYPGGMMGLIKAGAEGLATARAATAGLRFESDKLAAPLSQPSKIVAIGKNYADHAKETKSAVPTSPIVFTKFTTSIVGPGATIRWQPGLTSQVDYEAELAVIIGKKARRVTEAAALDYVFGYTCANDVSARDLQFSDGQWIRGKSLDTFCPLGPWLVTADEIADPQQLGIRCVLNGQTMQESHTSHMIFSVSYLISFLSQAFTLLPGDIILTGTPDGVGAFREPPVFLQDGDQVMVEVEQVGQLTNRCRVE